MRYLIKLLFKNFSAVWFLILEHHTPPPFFDIRTIYSFFVNGEGKEGGGNRIQTEHVIGGGGGGGEFVKF